MRSRAPATGTCDCQWDDHFEKRLYFSAVRHPYKQRFPVAELGPVWVPKVGARVFRRCAACRAAHMTLPLFPGAK